MTAGARFIRAGNATAIRQYHGMSSQGVSSGKMQRRPTKYIDFFAECSPAVHQFKPLILKTAKAFHHKCLNYGLDVSWLAILGHAVALAGVAECHLKPGHQLNADYLKKYLLGLHREFIEKPLAERSRRLKAEERERDRWHEAEPEPIEDLLRAILYPHETYGSLTKKQRRAVRKRERARAAVADKFLNTAGLSEMHRDFYLANGAQAVREAAAFHRIAVDYGYKLRERARKKIAHTVNEIGAGKYPELALAMQRQFPRRWWEVSDGLRWARGYQKPIRPTHIKAYEGLVIRQQRRWNEDEDAIIVIARENIDAFLDRLTDVAGIPSVGK